MKRFCLAVALIPSLLLPSLVRADADVAHKHGKPPGGVAATTFGPVALGRDRGLRLCHANAGDGSVSVEWVFLAVPPPADPTPVVGGDLEVAGRAAFELAAFTGNCANFAPDLTKHPEGVSIIAVLIGLRAKAGHEDAVARDLVASAQLTDITSGTPVTIGELLPAVQRVKVRLPQPVP